jgi:phosphoribosylanthranilate isomerase
MTIKICGITNPEDALAAAAAGATAIGFNFYPRSPRYIAPQRAAEIATPAGVRRVGVFVNEPAARVEEIARIARLDVAQLHGDERPADYPAGLVVWKAVRVTDDFDLSLYAECPAEALLLDGPAAGLYGGAGNPFDWSRLAGESACPPRMDAHRKQGGAGAFACQSGRARFSLPIILAGGLDASNVARAVAIAHPWGVDACSRIEAAPGKKDHKKMTEFLQAAREALRA